jgi:hypothetical protein
VNRATSETLRMQATQEGLVPLKNWIKVWKALRAPPGLEPRLGLASLRDSGLKNKTRTFS